MENILPSFYWGQKLPIHICIVVILGYSLLLGYFFFIENNNYIVLLADTFHEVKRKRDRRIVVSVAID